MPSSMRNEEEDIRIGLVSSSDSCPPTKAAKIVETVVIPMLQPSVSLAVGATGLGGETRHLPLLLSVWSTTLSLSKRKSSFETWML